ncbi:hypothetical protein M3Y95_01175500 [Aphelenchoides besseyi]|nr:hypothetical protein M3Y95_01175500 [Aphelenchoides besseyi]
MAHDEQPDLVFDVELEGNLDWGIKVSENLHVIAIRDGGPFTGKCEIGDRIIQVNEIPMKTLEEFEHIAAQTNSMHIEVTRGLKTVSFYPSIKPTSHLQNEVQLLPPEREKNVQRRPGYAYRLVQIDYQKGCKFGLGIKHHQNKVFVSRVDDGSLSARALMLGDRLIDVNGNPVSDKDVARDLLLRSLQKFRTVTLIIERAESDEAKNATRQAMAASELQPPSVAMNSDIRDIVQRQNAKMQKGPVAKKTGIMSRGQASKGRVQIRSEQKNLIIATDHEGKPLKHVGPSK